MRFDPTFGDRVSCFDATFASVGADPLLAMPDVETLSTSLLKRKAPIKAVLLDQNGVGTVTELDCTT